MSASYQTLLDATIQHLQKLKADGVKFVPVAAETLASLANSPAQPARPMATHSPAPTAKPLSTSPSVTPKPSPPMTTPPPAAPSPKLRTSRGPAKTQAMAELRARALACVKCPHLASSRKNVVFGVGSIDAELMFIGEAPGADEDELGEPFVGRAGQLLTKIIQAMGHGRDTVYIANILKCRPNTPGQSAGNRKPTPDETETCQPYLLEQIDLIRPKVLVALGATAVDGLLGKTEGISKLRGQWRTFRDIPLMPTYHPAYLLRNQSLSEKRKVWEDMLQVLEKIEAPISEKQRGFFLK